MLHKILSQAQSKVLSRLARAKRTNCITNSLVVYLTVVEEKEERCAIYPESFAFKVDLPRKHTSNRKSYGQTFLGLSR